MKINFPWEKKGIVLTAPLTNEVDTVVKFIDEYLAPRAFDTVVLQVRYRYQFKSHPELWGYDPLSFGDVKKLLDVCKKNGIKLVPKMNLFGHQSGLHNEPTDGILHGHNEEKVDIFDALLREYPELDEQRGTEAVYYARSICPSSERAKNIVCELIDELLDVFESDTIHIGCDEAFNLGICPDCKDTPKGTLFANWVNAINAHVKKRGGKTMMWGDRLISQNGTPYHGWEACDGVDTYTAIDSLSKDILICDWHYDKYNEYKSIDLFYEKGFKIMVSPWRNKDALEAFISYAKEHDKGHVEGILMTTWCASGDLANVLLYGKKGRWQHTDEIAKTLNEIF